jgi:hypothetical protein
VELAGHGYWTVRAIVRNRVVAVVGVLVLVALWAGSGSSSEKQKRKPGVGRTAAGLPSGRAVPRPLRDAKGDRVVPIKDQFTDLVELKAGLVEGRRALAAMTPDAPEFVELSQEVSTMHAALTRTRLDLLQEWSSETRTRLVMDVGEQRQYFAIINAQAALIASGERPAPPSARKAPSAAIEALLGPQRFAQYQALQKSFFPAGVHPAEILP